MIPGPAWAASLRGRAATLAALVVAQTLCAAFFIGDAISDLSDLGETGGHVSAETFAAAALAAGVVVMARELRRLLERNRALEQGMMVARGRMAEVIEAFFDRWGLTPAERDVALFALKGLDNEAIAAARGAATGTVRAQTARVYAKAGVTGRPQLMSLFIEELLAEPLSAGPGAPPAPDQAAKAAPEPALSGR